MKRIRSLLFLALALGIGLYSLPSAALQFNYSTRLTLTDCDTADESGFNTGMTALCYDLTAQRDEIWNGSAWVAYLGAGSSSSSPAYVTPVDAGGTSMAVDRSSTPAADVPGFMPWAVRDDALATLAEADGEATPFRVDSQGRLWTSSVNYVTENNISADSIAVAASGFTTLIDIDTGATQAYNLLCWLHVDADGSNVDDVDGLKVYIVPEGVTIGANTPVALGGQSGTNTADFTSPSAELVNFVRTTDGDADLVNLDEDDESLLSIKVPASSAVRISVSLNNDGTMDALCTHD